MKSPQLPRIVLTSAAVAAALFLVSAPLLAQGEPVGLAERLRGTWSSAASGQLLRFDGDRCVIAFHTQQTLMSVRYDNAASAVIRKVLGGSGPSSEAKISFADDTHATLHGKQRALELVRIAGPGDEVPEAVRTSPLALGTRELKDGELERIQAELKERCDKEQAIRHKLSKVEHEVRKRMAEKGEKGPAFMAPEVQAVIGEMSKIDRGNTRWIHDLLLDIGWIDVKRFGEKANGRAFLIVQHCGNVRMLQPVVQALKAEADGGHVPSGQRFALMHDRLSLSMGGQQRYGSQLHSKPDGTLYFPRLEDPANVDARRSSVGLGSLTEYAARFDGDGKVELPEGYEKTF